MTRLLCAMAACLVLTGCLSAGPVISKSSMGNLQIEVNFPAEYQGASPSIYLDGSFIGNVSPRMPVLYAKRGERVVRVECPGFKTYEKAILILGDPNHQVLNITMEKR